jgi:hypothetical protein
MTGRELASDQKPNYTYWYNTYRTYQTIIDFTGKILLYIETYDASNDKIAYGRVQSDKNEQLWHWPSYGLLIKAMAWRPKASGLWWYMIKIAWLFTVFELYFTNFKHRISMYLSSLIENPLFYTK